MPSFYSSSHPLFSWPERFCIGQIWQASLRVFTLSLSPLQTNAHTTRWLVYLYNAHRLSSLMNAPKRSEYSACIANQHQLCTLTAPDVSSKMKHICSAVRGEQCRRGWEQSPEWPRTAGAVGLPWKCSHESVCKILSPRTCCSGEAELRTRPAGKIPRSAKTAELGWPEHGNSLAWLRTPQVCSCFFIIQVPYSKLCFLTSTFTMNCQETGNGHVQWAF